MTELEQGRCLGYPLAFQVSLTEVAERDASNTEQDVTCEHYATVVSPAVSLSLGMDYLNDPTFEADTFFDNIEQPSSPDVTIGVNDFDDSN